MRKVEVTINDNGSISMWFIVDDTKVGEVQLTRSEASELTGLISQALSHPIGEPYTRTMERAIGQDVSPSPKQT